MTLPYRHIYVKTFRHLYIYAINSPRNYALYYLYSYYIYGMFIGNDGEHLYKLNVVFADVSMVMTKHVKVISCQPEAQP
jgi:hypothetical protein